MPNLAFHLEVLDQVINKLVALGDARGGLMKNNIKFAALGALGPDMLRYLPISADLSTTLASLTTTTPVGQISLTTLTVKELQELFLNPVGAIYSLVFRELVVPNWSTLNEVKAFLDKLDAIAANQTEWAAVAAQIPTLLQELQTIMNKATALESQLPVQVPKVAAVVGQIIGLPPWMQQTLTIPTEPSDPRANRLSEFLRWHNSGEFAENLLKAASTDQEKAFALGWITHVASAVTGEPFINNISGGPYRTHWWRNRFVSNFVDSWTFGFFETNAQMNGDNPTPPYASWKSLCSANLQDRINVAGLSDGSGGDVPAAVKAMASGNLGTLPGQFPADIADLLEKVVNQTYPVASQPIAGFTAETFKEAFVGAFAVYWFMTSGSGPMGDNPISAPPGTCTTAPSWITSNSTPSPQQAGLNTGGAVCAAILAIFALVLLLFGDLPAGLAALAAALAAPVINWDTVKCNLFWLRNTLVTAENALRDALVKGGLAYPPAAKLGTIDVNNQTHPALDSSVPTGIALTQSNAFSEAAGVTVTFENIAYPRVMDNSNSLPPDLNFASFPKTAATEQPRTENLIPPGKYPDFVVSAGLQHGGLMNNSVFPSLNIFFGGAVANAVELIIHGSPKLPNYNLDADRGDGWKGWHPQPGSLPSSGTVNAVHD
jgi:hypothetical protein